MKHKVLKGKRWHLLSLPCPVVLYEKCHPSITRIYTLDNNKKNHPLIIKEDLRVHLPLSAK